MNKDNERRKNFPEQKQESKVQKISAKRENILVDERS